VAARVGPVPSGLGFVLVDEVLSATQVQWTDHLLKPAVGKVRGEYTGKRDCIAVTHDHYNRSRPPSPSVTP
jgi:hypothetical protein